MIMSVSVISFQNFLSKLFIFVIPMSLVVVILEPGLVRSALTPKGCGTGSTNESLNYPCNETNSKCSPLHKVISSLEGQETNKEPKPSNEWTEEEENELMQKLVVSTNLCNFLLLLDCLDRVHGNGTICACNPHLTDCYVLLQEEQKGKDIKSADEVKIGYSHKKCSKDEEDSSIQSAKCKALVGVPCQYREQSQNPSSKEVLLPINYTLIEVECTEGAQCLTIKPTYYTDLDGKKKVNIDQSILDTSGGSFLTGFPGPVQAVLRKRATKVCVCNEAQGYKHHGNGLCKRAQGETIRISGGLIFYSIIFTLFISYFL